MRGQQAETFGRRARSLAARTLGMVTVAVGITAPPAVQAQIFGDPPQAAQAERRPFRGIFTGLSTPNTPQSLVLSGSLFGAYDDNVLAGLSENSARNWRMQRRGPYTGAVGSLDYAIARRGNRFSVGAQAGAALRYYRNNEFSNVSPDAELGASFSYGITRTTSLGVSHEVRYARQYGFYLAPLEAPEATEGLALHGTSDLDLFQLPALRNITKVSLGQRLWRHASVSADYHLRAVHFMGEEPVDPSDPVTVSNRLTDYRTQSGALRFQYNRPISAHATMNLGYGIRVSDARLGTGEPQTMHNVLAGIGYSRALSFSRRTAVSFSTGSSVAVKDELDDPTSESRTHLRVTGTATLAHELGRTWTARLAYRRGFTFQEGFDEPFFTDSITASLGGLVTRRLSFSASGRWAVSRLNRSGDPGQRLFFGGAQSTYALNGFLALYAQYLYYEYDFDDGVLLDSRFPRALHRQGVRAGIVASIPLFQ